MSRKAVVLMNMGGPDSLEAVQPFLFNLFNDPYIISLPLGSILRKPLARFISKRRSQNVIKQYEQIGGKSPINEWTERQRLLLQEGLRKKDKAVDVHVAMRYWHPLTDETAANIEQTDYSRIALMPLYPHYSKATTVSSFAEWERVYRGDASKVVKINVFYKNERYISAINRRIDEALSKFPEPVRKEVQLVFSAHGTPVSLVRQGDPYKGQIEETVQLVMEQRKFDHEHILCFQSKVGPEKWLEPAANTTIQELSRSGKHHLLVIPISFVSDHIETLFELNIGYRQIAREWGNKNYIVTAGLNDSDLFIKALTEIVSEAIWHHE